MDMSASNYNPDATVDNGSCMFDIFGCMDMSANNYNPDATVDDFSCMFDIFGCMDMSASNYNPDATVDNGSCAYDTYNECPILDFTYDNTGSNMTILFDIEFVESNDIQIGQMIGVFANVDDSLNPNCYGASEWTGEQFALAVWADDTTTPEVDGFQFNDTINIGYQLPDGTIMGLESSPILFTSNDIHIISSGTFLTVCSSSEVSGCTESTALNYNPDATVDDGSCDYNYSGCIYPPEWEGNTGTNMTVFLTQNVVSALPLTSSNPYIVVMTNSGLVVGSSSLADEDLINGQQSIAVWGDDSQTQEVDGAITGEEFYFQLVDSNSLFDLDISFSGPNNFTVNSQLVALGVTYNFVCSDHIISDVLGCTDSSALNYNPDATVDDGSCAFDIFGCTDSSALNYNPDALLMTGLVITIILDAFTHLNGRGIPVQI